MSVSHHGWLVMAANPKFSAGEAPAVDEASGAGVLSPESLLAGVLPGSSVAVGGGSGMGAQNEEKTQHYPRTHNLNHTNLKSFRRLDSGLGRITITFHGGTPNQTHAYHTTTTGQNHHASKNNPNPVFTITQDGAHYTPRHTKEITTATIIHPLPGVTHTTIHNTTTGAQHTYPTPTICTNQQIVISLFSVGHQLVTHFTTSPESSPEETARAYGYSQS